MPCLPRETKVDVAKCHACHPKCRGVGAQSAPKRATRPSPVPQVPRLPRKENADAGNAKRRWPAMKNECGCRRRATPATQSEGGCREMPYLIRNVKVDVAKCYACPSGAQTRHQSQPSAVSAKPATRSEHGCRQVPHLPREVKGNVAKCQRLSCKVPRRHRATNGAQAAPMHATSVSPVP